MQESLQNNILPKCSVCQSILEVKRFSFEEFEQQKHATSMEPTNFSLANGEKREHVEVEMENPKKKQKIDVLPIIEQNKDFKILEPGAKGKRFPVQCLICSRSA